MPLKPFSAFFSLRNSHETGVPVNILMVLSTRKYPPERRVEREALALVKAGHTVYLLARRGPGQSKEEIVDGVHVIRVPLPFQKQKAIADMLYFLFQRYLVFFRILAACRKYSIQALHVHNIPYGLAAILAGKWLKIPVVLDMHEYYVEILKDSLKAKMYRWYRPFAALPLWFMSQEEKYICRKAYKIIIMVPEQGERLLGLGANEKQFVIVSNTEDPDFFLSIPINEAIIQQYKKADQLLMLYVGGINPYRGLDLVIKAMPIILKSIPNAKLIIAGYGESQAELERLTRELNLCNVITFTGRVPFEDIPTYIGISDLCLVPSYVTPHVDTTITNKLFQYMLHKKPVVSSDAKPVARIFRETNCGLTFKDRDFQSLAQAVIELKDSHKRELLGNNGYQAAINQYHWKHSENALLNIYFQFENSSKTATILNE